MRKKCNCSAGSRGGSDDNFQDLIVAIGKAAHAMVDGICRILPPAYTIDGIVSAPTKPVALAGMTYFHAGHPIPDEDSWQAAEAILSCCVPADEHTLVFFLLSGGGSALLELPLDSGDELEDLQAMNLAW